MRLLPIVTLAAAVWAQVPAPKPAPKSVTRPAPAASPAQAAAKPAPAATPTPAAKPAPDQVVFAVGDLKMTAAEFDKYLALMPESLRNDARQPGGKLRVAQRLLDIKSFAWEARQRKLDATPQAQALLALQVESAMASLLYQQVLASAKPDAAAVEKYYGEHKNEYESARARHILLRFKGSPVPLKPNQKDLTEEEALAKAQELRKRLAAGEDFAVIAKAESDDAGSGVNGGDLGRFGRGQMVPPFEQAVYAQPIGQVGEPVKTQFGWHIIQVQERGATPLETIRATIEQRLQPQAAQQAMEELKKRVPATLDAAYFGK